MKKEKFDITGMSCSACSTRVQKAVAKLEGTEDVTVNLLTNSMQLEYDPQVTNTEAIIAAVEQAGYGASVKAPLGAAAPAVAAAAPAEKPLEKAAAEMKHRLIWSIIFLLPTLYISMHGLFAQLFGLPVPDIVRAVFDGPANAITFAFAQLMLVLPIMYLNRRYYIVGVRTLLQGAPNMDSLVGMGSMASALFGVFAIFRMSWGLGHGDMALVADYSRNLYFESAGMIVTLITVGKYLEARAKGQTSRALEKLMDLAPKQAVVLRGGAEVTIPAAELRVGDHIVVKPGERLAADGVVIEGQSAIDESAITGESIPAAKGPGDKVTSATINKNGRLIVEAQRVGQDTTISQIINLVDEASASKAPIARMADKVAGIFVPAVITIAVIVGGIWLAAGASTEFAFSIAISILVISCPCALGLATPVAIMVGTGKGAENGILIKSGEALEIAQSIDTVVMDKTGTITEGHPRVTALKAYNGVDESVLLGLAAGLEQGSEHPLAEAVTEYAAAQGAAPLAMTGFQALPGRGVQAECQGRTYFAGNSRLMQELHVDTSAAESELGELADAGATPLLFAEQVDGRTQLIGIIGAADMEKATSRDAIKKFAELGIKVVMLTGDNARTAEAVRRRLDIPQVIAGVLPGDKAAHIKKLQDKGHKVAMIGDGINDAPALAQADLGIAIGAGTDVAIESADAVLIRSDLRDAVSAVRLSRAVLKNIKENLFWAFFYNVICIPLAAGALYPAFGIKLSPVIGAAAMSMSSVCVVMNALRLKFFRVDRETGEATASPKPAASAAGGVAAAIDESVTASGEGEDATMKKQLKIDGMMCAHCQQHVHDALAKMEGVTSVSVNLEAGTADVEATHDIDQADFAKVIEAAGYQLVG